MMRRTRTTPDRLAADDAPRPERFVFVGERRSQRAVQMGVYWEDGRLAARTLHEALRAVGLDPRRQIYLNLYADDGQRAVKAETLLRLQMFADTGLRIVGMGRLVQAALARAGVPHLRLVHPAARGAIRARAAYHAHVSAVLGTQRRESGAAAAA